MMSVRFQQAIRHRPWLSFWVGGGTLAVATAAGTEAYSDIQENRYLADQSDQCSLPMEYNRQQIREYWIRRPVSVITRLGKITYELSPCLASYMHYSLYLSNPGLHALQENDDKYEVRLEESKRLQAVQLREALTNLGPAFIKAGQQLSIRPDLVPPVVLEELQQLCDSVRPIPDDVALEVLKKELGLSDRTSCSKGKNNNFASRKLDDVFENLHLVAAASLGQVYKARLKDSGRDVAIKIQRPGMRKAFSLDLFLLQGWGDFMDAFTTIFTKQKPFHRTLFDSFSRGSYSELDYQNEAKNQSHFQYELGKRNCPVKIPDVYYDYSTQLVLTTEWVDGVKLADSPSSTIRRLIPVGVELFLTQLLDIGAFHSDPHPGNLLVTKDGKLCLLDFGLCAEVNQREREAMTRAIVHLLYRDFDMLIHSDTKELGFLPRDFDTEELKPILTKVLTGGLLESGSDMKKRKRKLMEISNELNEIFFRYPFQVPGFFALVTRGLGLLEGIALVGDPDFDIFMASAPYATKRAASILGAYGYRRMTKSLTRRNRSSGIAEL
ncbi:ABC1 family-domain containing protein [Nitzschia inconspicua]|uniref:ABC1 family-domain containing protein n=1 Tax=Nitzschia inconspicua TaxID=303405 RepID=A0A9K3K8R5_9STRA|nr:ABC1 family-domain containing protein [Nitzschia inconspicua]